MRKGQSYKLPDGTVVTCIGPTHGVENMIDSEDPALAPTLRGKITSGGFHLSSDDRLIRLAVNPDGSVLQRRVIEQYNDPYDTLVYCRYGGWRLTDLSPDDLQAIEN